MQNRLTETIKKYRHLCDYMEIRVEDYEDTTIALKTDKSEIKNSVEMGGNIRVLIKGGWGFSCFNDLNLMDHFASKTVDQAKAAGKSKSFLAPVPSVTDEVPADIITDPREISIKDKKKLLDSYNQLILNYDKKIIKNSSIIYNDQFKKKYFANSEGTYIYQEFLDLDIKLSIKGTEKNLTQTIAVGAGSSKDFNVCRGLEKRIEKACSNVIKYLRAPAVKAGRYTVIINPGLAGVLAHESFGHSCEADFHYKNKSMQEEMKPGRILGSKILNIYDTGLDEGTRGYMKYDDEGVKTEKTYLIKDGVLAGRLHSRETAARLKEKPTGSARAVNYTFPPVCRMRHTCIEKGDTPFSDMIKDVKLGLYAVKTAGGGGGQYFTLLPAYSYMIRDGEIAEMVRNVRLTGDLFQTLKDIDMVGQDFKIVNSSGGCGKFGQYPLPITASGPSVRILNLTVGGEA